MDLIKKNIHMNKLNCKSSIQLTIDKDMNVPDVKPDIEQIVKDFGTVLISESIVQNDKLLMKGSLMYEALYIGEGSSRPINVISGDIPFDDTINLAEGCTDGDISLKWEIEDLTIGVINSRKISIKAIIRFNVAIEAIQDIETAVGVAGEDVHYINKTFPITGIGINKKDTYRIKDEIHLPSNKANIFEMIYKEVELRNVEFRLLDNKFSIKGELPVFFMYIGDGDEAQVEFYETELPFGGIVDCSGCNEDMIENITCSVLNKTMEVKPDTDGEERVVDLEVVLNLDIKAYMEDEVDALSDAYSTKRELIPIYEKTAYENLLLKNTSKTRVMDQIRVEENKPEILQICHANGVVKIDDTDLTADGIEVSGIIDVNILYISSDDQRPINCMKGVVPFSQLVEVKGINENSIFEIKPMLEQMSVIMLDSNEIEVKAVVALNTIAFERIEEDIINEILEEEINIEKIQALPSIIGYIVKSNDTLWDIAKRFYTTTDNIMEMNDMDSEVIHVGDKILIMKQMDEVF